MTTPDANSPADADAPPRVAVPWWRRRRRLFYLAVVLLAIAAPWGGWRWWYRADFPLPPERMRVSLGLGSDNGLLGQWLLRQRRSLMTLKINRETGRLQLEGTTWENSITEARLTFGEDGRLRVDTSHGDPVLYPFNGSLDTISAGSKTALAALNGTFYQFEPRVKITPEEILRVVALTPSSSNLSLPDSPWQGLLYCGFDDSRIEVVLIPKDLSSDVEIFFGSFKPLPDQQAETPNGL
jgi:hypothetical protein